MNASPKTFHFNFAWCVNSLVFLNDSDSQEHWHYNKLLLSMHPPHARYFFLGFHIYCFGLECMKVESCSLWPSKQWKFAKLGKNSERSAKILYDEAAYGKMGRK